MNLNYNNIRLEDYPQEVVQKYQFPQDEAILRRYIRGEQEGQSKDKLEYNYDLAKRDCLAITVSLIVGIASYAKLYTPGGKVIRDRYDASLSVPRRFIRRAVPFLALGYPIYLFRSRVTQGNGYAPN